MSRLLVVMYHYVRDAGAPWPELKGMTMEAFRRQLDQLARVGELVRRRDLPRFMASGQWGFMLTFDDGLRDHSEYVLPELQRRGWEGWFFIPTFPLAQLALLATHKQHLLQYCAGMEKFYPAFLNAAAELNPSADLSGLWPTAENLAGAQDYLSQFDFYTPMERLFRMARDKELPRELVNQATDMVFDKLVGAEAAMVEKFYMTESQVRELSAAGMVVGGHTHNHVALAGLAADEQAREITTCLDHLKAWTGTAVDSFSYPFGSYDDTSVDQLANAGVTHAFTTESGWVPERFHPLRINRIDCTQVDRFLSDEMPVRELQKGW